MDDTEEILEIEASAADAGPRLDAYLADCIEDVSRSFVQKLIKDGRVRINDEPAKRASRLIAGGERIRVELPPPPSTELRPEPIPLEILWEDSDVLVVNKPAGMVAHPAPGHPSGTLVNAVLHHCADFQRPGEDPARPGIVHRLDKDTSGVMVVAKSPRAFKSLSEQARAHTFGRRYLALVRGVFKEETLRIDAPVGRSMTDRKRMAVTGVASREAVTRARVLEQFEGAALVALTLETGRTHQIRVHMRYIGRPVLGDPVYGVADFSRWDLPEETRLALEGLRGQALHAESLAFDHPASGERVAYTAPLPPDMEAALTALRGTPPGTA